MLDPVDFFKCLSDETRFRCMLLLHTEGELCVCELTHALGLSQPKISRHLAQLRQYGLLIDSRKGQWVYYQVNIALPDWVVKLLNEAVLAVQGQSTYAEDVLRLKAMNDRPVETKFCGEQGGGV